MVFWFFSSSQFKNWISGNVACSVEFVYLRRLHPVILRKKNLKLTFFLQTHPPPYPKFHISFNFIEEQLWPVSFAMIHRFDPSFGPAVWPPFEQYQEEVQKYTQKIDYDRFIQFLQCRICHSFLVKIRKFPPDTWKGSRTKSLPENHLRLKIYLFGLD